MKSLGDAIQFAGDRCAGAKVSDIVPPKAGQTFFFADCNGNTLSINVPELHTEGYVRQDHLDRYQDRKGPCRQLSRLSAAVVQDLHGSTVGRRGRTPLSL